MRYSPGASDARRNRPESSLVARLDADVPMWTMVTTAPATVEPVASITRPDAAPATFCARALVATPIRTISIVTVMSARVVIIGGTQFITMVLP